MEFVFPLYTELKVLEGPVLPHEDLMSLLAKITQLDSTQAEIIYAIMQAYALENARSKKTAKERFGGSWLLQKPKRGVRFKTNKVPEELRILLAKYIMFITGDERMGGKGILPQ